MFSPFQNPNNLKLRGFTPPPIRTKRQSAVSGAYAGASVFDIEVETNALLTPADDARIHYVGIYNPTRRRCKRLLQESYQPAKEFTALVKTVKNKNLAVYAEHQAAIESFANLLSHVVTNGSISEKIIICSVPTSTPEDKYFHGPTVLAQRLAEYNHHIDGTNLVYRSEAKLACHKGGARTPEEVVKGLQINEELIRGRAVLLLDDVVTTGTNMAELYKRLVNCGATRVVCLALGCTLINRNINNNRQSILERFLLDEFAKIETDQARKEMFQSLPHSLKRAFPLSPDESPSQPQFLPYMRAKRAAIAVAEGSKLDFSKLDPVPVSDLPPLEYTSQNSSFSFGSDTVDEIEYRFASISLEDVADELSDSDLADIRSITSADLDGEIADFMPELPPPPTIFNNKRLRRG